MDVKAGMTGEIPSHLKDPHYASASKLGHGVGYKYPHEYPNSWVKQQYLPNELVGKHYYVPKQSGQEKYLSKVYERLGGILIIVRRKILTAVLSSLLFALIFSIIGSFEDGGFEWNLFYNLYYLNLLFAVTYGVITSFVSDFVSKEVFKKDSSREISSFVMHCGFGLALFVLGVVSAISFFIIDRLLRKVKVGWLSVIIALLIVVVTYIILINR